MRAKVIEKLERIKRELDETLEEMEDCGNEITWNIQNDCELMRKLLEEVEFAHEVFELKQENPLNEVDWRDLEVQRKIK